MRSIRPANSLAWILACLPHGVYGETLKLKYTWPIPSEDLKRNHLWSNFEKCHSCLLDNAGVNGVSIEAYEEENPQLLINSFPLGFLRVLSRCMDGRFLYKYEAYVVN
uniref:CHXC18 n=1 Tax=Albugo laibachii Nc14 TaxID=890382 RepID=F0WTN1_9STRA|nr:CHXC18 [Albugo laibachii Nc14]|eukprot:CCA24723.1 CHXC18 [Albugo laibachii Nc14]